MTRCPEIAPLASFGRIWPSLAGANAINVFVWLSLAWFGAQLYSIYTVCIQYPYTEVTENGQIFIEF
jgi:hypothetical protein